MGASRGVLIWRRPLVVVMAIAGAIACSEIITGPDDDAAARPRSMRISPARMSLSQAETARVTATLHDASGAVTESEPGRTLFYRSSDASIASVDSLTGFVTALTDGTVSVQAVYGALMLGIPVQVLARARLEIMSGQGQVAEQGDTLAARLVVRALGATGAPLADTAVTFAVLTGDGALEEVSARTDASGLAQARWQLGLALGAQSVVVRSPALDSVIFTATATSGTGVASIEIAEVTGALVGVGATRQLSAVAYNRAQVALTGATIAWTSASPEVATVDASGLVTAVSAGTSEIRATSGAVYDSVIVIVEVPFAAAKLALGGDVEHPVGLQVARTLTLPAAVGGPTTVTLRSLDTANVELALDNETRGAESVNVFLPAGATTAIYWLQGVEGTIGGITQLVAEAPGWAPDTMEVTNVQPAAQLTLVGPSTVPAMGGDDPVLVVTVGRNDGGALVPMAVRAFGVVPTFDVFALDQAVAMVLFSATSATLGANTGPTICAAFDLRPGYSATALPNIEFGTPASLSVARLELPGTASFSLASLSGFEVIGGPVTITITGSAALPKLSLGPDIEHPAQLHEMYAVTLPTTVNNPLLVAITTSDVAGARVASGASFTGTERTEIEVEGGTAVGGYWIQGQVGAAGRPVTIIASAVGYEPDTMLVTMARPAYALTNIPPGTRPAVGGEDPILVLTVGASVADGVFVPMALSPGITPPSFTLRADQPTVGLVQFFASDMVVGANQGPATTVTFAMQVGFNQTSDGNFLVPASIRIARTGAAGDALVSVQSAPPEFDGAYPMAGYTFTTASPVPVISVDPGALSYVAAIGAAAPLTRTIAITNGGAGTLSGLATEVTYGAGASDWLAVSLDATTAPATLTAVASPEFVPVGTFTATITISSTVPDVAPVNIDVTITITPGARIVIVSGDGQQAAWNQYLTDSIKIRVLDANDQPVAGVYVRFEQSPNGGSPYPSNPMTDAGGYAATTWRMSTVPGIYTLTAILDGFASAVFTGTSLAGTVVTRVEITAARTTFVGTGETEQFTAAAYNVADSLITSAVIVWSSQTPAVATVSATGLVTILALGETWIVARVGDVSDMQQVMVNAPVVCDFGYGAVTLTGAPTTTNGRFCPGIAYAPTGPNANGDMQAVWRETFNYGSGSYYHIMSVQYNPTTGVVSSASYYLNDPTYSVQWTCSPFSYSPPACTNVSVNPSTGVVTYSGLVLGTWNPITFTGTLTIATPPPVPPGPDSDGSSDDGPG